MFAYDYKIKEILSKKNKIKEILLNKDSYVIFEASIFKYC